MLVFTIYDSKAEAYLQPFFSPTKNTALRMFERAANDGESDIARWAEDYTLFEIGTWDQDTGLLLPHEAKINLGLASELKAPEAK